MTLLPKAPRAILRLDPIRVDRPSTSSDAEGDSGARTAVFEGRGTVSTASMQEQLLAAERGTRIDKVLALELGLDVKAGDFVTAGGVTYEVVAIEPRRLYQRAVMRVVA